MIKNIQIIKVKMGFVLHHEGMVIAQYEDYQKACEMRLFYAGIKPMVSQNFSKDQLPMYLLRRYHHEIRQLKGTEEVVFVLLFQDTEVQKKYIDLRSEETDDQHFSKKGELYGYPPAAIADFLERRKEPLETRSSIGWKRVSFHGIQFICKHNHVEECLEWLQSTYNIPKEYQAGIHVRDAFVSNKASQAAVFGSYAYDALVGRITSLTL